MKYVAILGRQPELGLIELESVLGDIAPLGRYAAVFDTKTDLHGLGGALKIGRVIYRGKARDVSEAPLPLAGLSGEGKITFGLSYYGLQATNRFVVANGLTLKKRLRSRGSVRFVAPQRGTALSAAEVKFNGLLRRGFELLVVIQKQEMIVAVTEQIQDIDWYSARDYDRPVRSAKVGMLPPKLAQLMVNTTSAGVVYDPFCGTGVVLQEALLLDRAAGGSDISPEMVAASTQNLDWLREKRGGLRQASAVEADARSVVLPPDSLAIVSEGYLGPHLSKRPSDAQYRKLSSELRTLYLESLINWRKQLPSKTVVTITAPIWHTEDGWRGLGLIDRLSDIGYTLKSFAHVDSRKVVYRRPNQIVGRQLLIMRTI